MICEEALLLMSAKLDDALSPDEEKALAAHLAVCPACAELMKTLSGQDEQLAALREPAPAALKAGVLDRIAQAESTAKPKTQSLRRRWFGPGSALGAVAAVLVLLVGFGVISLPKWRSTDRATAMQENYNNIKDAEAVTGACAPAETNCPAEAVNESEEKASWNNSKSAADGAGLAGNVIQFPSLEATLESEGSSYCYYFRINKDQYASAADSSPELPCVMLSAEKDAAVLLYTDFDAQSLFTLLEREEPQLYAALAELEPETRDGLICYPTDCGTVLAIQEWLLSQLPHEEEMDSDLIEAETELMTHMEALDPGSESLYRIITWAPKDHPVSWPESWPADWADRLRTGDNWALFFPNEDYVPNVGKTAYLVFCDK